MAEAARKVADAAQAALEVSERALERAEAIVADENAEQLPAQPLPRPMMPAQPKWPLGLKLTAPPGPSRRSSTPPSPVPPPPDAPRPRYAERVPVAPPKTPPKTPPTPRGSVSGEVPMAGPSQAKLPFSGTYLGRGPTTQGFLPRPKPSQSADGPSWQPRGPPPRPSGNAYARDTAQGFVDRPASFKPEQRSVGPSRNNDNPWADMVEEPSGEAAPGPSGEAAGGPSGEAAPGPSGKAAAEPSGKAAQEPSGKDGGKGKSKDGGKGKSKDSGPRALARRTSGLMEAINEQRWNDALQWVQYSDEWWCALVAEGVPYAGYTALHLAAQRVPPDDWTQQMLFYDELVQKALSSGGPSWQGMLSWPGVPSCQGCLRGRGAFVAGGGHS